MADRKGQARGGPGEQWSGGNGPVIGDIERMPPLPRPGPAPGEPDRWGVAGTVVQALRGLAYPLARDDLVREAAGRGAEGGILDILVHLPDRVYVSAEDVVEELGRSL